MFRAVLLLLMCVTVAAADDQLRPARNDVDCQASVKAADGQNPKPANVRFHAVDSEGATVACRIHLRDSNGKPQKANGLPFWHDHFVCDGRADVDLKPGQYSWDIERGPEYSGASGTIEVVAGKAAKVDVTLRRIARLREEGWYSGDLHVHRPVADVPLLMKAEDLDFAPVIEWWNNAGGKLGSVDQTEVVFDGHRRYQLRAGEDEREGGALLYFGLTKPLNIASSSREFPSPLKFVNDARAQAPNVWVDIEKPFWWDVPTWLASGKMNSIGIANNHMCRSRMLANEAWGKPRDVSRLPNPVGNGYLSQEIYYHALNCGLRLPPTAGSASGVLPNPVGYNRVYVHLGGEKFTRDSWFAALAKGRCFVTNGPLLRVTAQPSKSRGDRKGVEGVGSLFRSSDPQNQKPRQSKKTPDLFPVHPTGTQFVLTDGEPLSIDLQIALTSTDPVSELEVIHNGRIIKRIPCSIEKTSQQIQASLSIREPGWFLVRAIADVDHTFRFASTAPWYAGDRNDRKGVGSLFRSSDRQTQKPRHPKKTPDPFPVHRPAAGLVTSSSTKRISMASAQFFLDWVDERIARIQKNVTDPDQLRAVLTPHENARLFWANKVALANADLHPQDKNVVASTSLRAQRLPMVSRVEPQPLLASIKRLIEAMDYVGSPLPKSVVDKLQQVSATQDSSVVTRRVQELLDPHCLAGVSIREGGPPLVKSGRAKRQLLEQGWRTFLVKVVNTPGVTRRLLVESPNAQPLPHSPADQVASRWMQLSSYEGRPLKANLSGLKLEYRIIQIYSRDPGSKNALLEFTISNKAGDDGALIREWRFDKGADGWNAMNQVELQPRDGSLFITATGDDPFMGAEVEARGGPMLLRFWAKSEVDGIGQLFWWTKDRPSPTGDRQTNYLIEPGEERLYEVPFTAESELAGVRIDPLVKPGKIRIDWIDLYSAQRTKNWTKLPLTFDCETATNVTFRIIDDEGLPGFAKFEIRDAKGRIYPAQSKRLAPDFFFQRHIYRGDGESVSLPPGDYTIKCSRGPETIGETKKLTVGKDPAELLYRVNRWVDPSKSGWWSGDHHIHAAGCLHYNNPTQGVKPNDMIRHIMGEDLKVGCCLTWGPCFDYQKRFFTGEVAEQSRYPYTLRYDVEVSGFGSHMSGHLNLLNLKQQIYPGGESKDHWPTLGLNTLRWAKKQGAVCGPAHSSIGLTSFIGRLPNTEGRDGPHDLPNFKLPAFDGIGANEFIVDVTHKVPGPNGEPVPAVDFISTMNTERVAEWNMWYHVLNCGFRIAASGETDFPCMSGERVGIGRVYAKVDGKLTFAKWVQSIGTGRSYVSDGLCHLLNFRASKDSDPNQAKAGEGGSQLKLTAPGNVSFQLETAALVSEKERLEAELIVNGYPVEKRSFNADGSIQDLTFRHKFKKSCWVAVRVFPHAHTNPIYVIVDDKPIRGSVDSMRWCLAGVEQCWKSKQNTYNVSEQADAKAAYEHARKVYSRLIQEPH